jgi:hypothetical protein
MFKLYPLRNAAGWKLERVLRSWLCRSRQTNPAASLAHLHGEEHHSISAAFTCRWCCPYSLLCRTRNLESRQSIGDFMAHNAGITRRYAQVSCPGHFAMDFEPSRASF